MFNVYLHDGKQVIKPEDLEERDIAELLNLYYGAGNEEITKQKWRDLLKMAVVAVAGGTCYVLLGIENQSEIHYAMPVRNMIYDAINYGTQVEETRNRHEREYRRNGKKVYADNGEFLSGFTRREKAIDMCKAWDDWKMEGCIEVCQENILNLLEEVFIVTDDIKNYILSQRNISTLKHWVKIAAKVTSVEDWKRKVTI